jgi:hypothetical protein
MFAGHYAAAFAAKAAEPKAPLWTLVAGCQLIDIGWSIFIATGIEHAEANPSLPGSAFVLSDMPWTHSLPAVIVWSVAAGFLSGAALRLSMRAAVLIGAVVFSHWLLDLLVHRPDLELFPNGPKVGLGLWNLPVPEQAVEMGLLAISGIFWGASRKSLGQSAWPAALFMAFLVALQIVVMFVPMPAGPLGVQQGLSALAVYILATLLAVPLDGKRASSPQASP